jgi:hypothetical protein
MFAFQDLKAYSYLTTIGGRWYFDRAFVTQRLKNQALFNYTLGKVLKPKKISLQPQKKK